MHRRTFVIALSAPAVAMAAPPLPQLNLVVEARVVERSAAARQGLGAAGGVVVGTTGSTSVTGSVTVRASGGTSSLDQVQRVLVLNGAAATLRISQLLPLKSVEWVWTPRGPGVAERTLWVDLGRGIEVTPSWPGAQAPVVLDLSIDAVAAAAADPAQAPRTAARTQVAVALGEWVPVASVSEGLARGAGTGGLTVSASSRSERSIEVRVVLP